MSRWQTVGAFACVGIVAWYWRYDAAKTVGGPAYTPPVAAVATAPQAPAWETVDLHDISAELPGTPVKSTSVEATASGSANVTAFTVKRSENSILTVRILDMPSARTWNAVGAVDGAAQGAVNALRSMDGVRSVSSVLNERRDLNGMPGRAIEVRVTPVRPNDPHFTMRSVYYSRWARIYEVTAVSADPASDEAAIQVLASVRAGAHTATVAAKQPTGGPDALNTYLQTLPALPEAAPIQDLQPPVYAAPPVPADHGPVHVSGYFRQDGTYVQPYTRSR